jgi:hypothetical protein
MEKSLKSDTHIFFETGRLKPTPDASLPGACAGSAI